MSLLVLGSIALDTVKTPVEEHGDLLGGSASYAAAAASYFSAVRLVGIVGSDFPRSEFDFWKSRKIDTEGVHVGQDDDAIAIAREKAGRKIIVGKSTHSFEQAVAAQRDGADYIGFGPIFTTPTKPDYKPIGLDDIKRVHAEVTVPIFCIGGIKIENLGELIAAGAKAVVVKTQKAEEEEVELVEDEDISTTILAEGVEIEEEPVAITRTVSGKTSKTRAPDKKKSVTFSRTSSEKQTSKKADKKKK